MTTYIRGGKHRRLFLSPDRLVDPDSTATCIPGKLACPKCRPNLYAERSATHRLVAQPTIVRQASNGSWVPDRHGSAS